MSVEDNNNKTLLDGDGEQCTFEFSFKIFKAADLKVYKVDKESGEMGDALTLDDDYTVSINKVGEGGSVTFTVAPGEDEQAGIYRDIEIIQPASIPTDTEYVEKTLENALDRSCMIDQQLQEQIDRCITIPAFSSSTTSSYDGVSTDLPVPVAENVLAWNSDGTALENYDVKADIADFESEVNTAISTFETTVNNTISETRTEFTAQIAEFETSVNTAITDFENEINATIAEVSEAAEKINELEEAVQTAVDNAAVATEQANAALTAAESASEQADRAQSIADELEEFQNSFPAAVNLMTWARLNDGKIYNIPFDDVKADSNRFILFEETEDRRSLRFKANTFIRLDTETDTRHLTLWEDLVINVENYLDEGETLTNGKDYSIFLVPDGDTGIAIKISLNKTAPTGYDTYNTRRIGGFHTECKDVGTVSDDHKLNGWLAGDIIPLSVWTLWHRPAVASPSGARYVEERDAWKTIYTQSGTGESTVFEYGGTTTRSRTTWNYELDLALVGWEFPTSIDFTISEQGIIPLKAVYGKAESSCTTSGGWVNENSVRMVTNGGDESTCGGLWIILQERGPAGGSSWSSGDSTSFSYAYQYGTVYRLLGGGAWGNSGYAGPSSRAGHNSALDTYTYATARGWSRPLRARQ